MKRKYSFRDGIELIENDVHCEIQKIRSYISIYEESNGEDEYFKGMRTALKELEILKSRLYNL